MIELKKKGVAIPSNIIDELRSAKLMIKISESAGGKGDTARKADEYLGNVESYLVNEAQTIFGSEMVEVWLRRLENPAGQANETRVRENKFITNVPRDQKWVRVEPISNLPSEKIQQIAKETNLSINFQKDGRLVVYGQPKDIKEFLKEITVEANKK